MKNQKLKVILEYLGIYTILFLCLGFIAYALNIRTFEDFKEYLNNIKTEIHHNAFPPKPEERKPSGYETPNQKLDELEKLPMIIV